MSVLAFISQIVSNDNENSRLQNQSNINADITCFGIMCGIKCNGASLPNPDKLPNIIGPTSVQNHFLEQNLLHECAQ